MFPLLCDPLIHYVQIGIGQQRTDNSALWGSVLVYGAFIHDPGSQHSLDDLQHTPISDTDVVQAV